MVFGIYPKGAESSLSSMHGLAKTAATTAGGGLTALVASIIPGRPSLTTNPARNRISVSGILLTTATAVAFGGIVLFARSFFGGHQDELDPSEMRVIDDTAEEDEIPGPKSSSESKADND